MRSAYTIGIVAAFGCVALAGFSIDRSGTELLSNGVERVVTIGAGDFYFESPDTIMSGIVRIDVANGGKDLHHVQLVRLDEGRTIGELLDLVGKGAPIPAWAHMVGGPNAPVPGDTATATLDLEPGSYGIVCWVHGADGVPHFMKGMFKGLVVVPAPVETGVFPKADAEMVLDDYTFTFSEPIVAGRRTLRIRNAAAQPHEVVIVRLAPGKSVMDLLGWFRDHQQGPPPGAPIGGTTFLAHDEENYVTIDFTPGRYGLLCFVPDAKDGQPHLAHGMVSEFEVAAAVAAK